LEKEKNTMREDTKLKPNEGDEVEMVQLTKIELRRSSSEAPARRKGSNRGNSLEAPPWFLGGRERDRVGQEWKWERAARGLARLGHVV
jgi:hypothetical protein